MVKAKLSEWCMNENRITCHGPNWNAYDSMEWHEEQQSTQQQKRKEKTYEVKRVHVQINVIFSIFSQNLRTLFIHAYMQAYTRTQFSMERKGFVVKRQRKAIEEKEKMYILCGTQAQCKIGVTILCFVVFVHWT